MLSLIIVGVWRGLGFNIIIFLAGLKGIPREMYDASAIDGANEWQQFWRVTLPMLSPTIFFAVVMAFISSFQVFELTFIMTQGGPSNSTTTLIYNTYLQGFTFMRMGYASAISVIFLLFVLVATVFQVRLQERWVHYDE
jgi:multiple sugar transport system permease protein